MLMFVFEIYIYTVGWHVDTLAVIYYEENVYYSFICVIKQRCMLSLV